MTVVSVVGIVPGMAASSALYSFSLVLLRGEGCSASLPKKRRVCLHLKMKPTLIIYKSVRRANFPTFLVLFNTKLNIYL